MRCNEVEKQTASGDRREGRPKMVAVQQAEGIQSPSEEESSGLSISRGRLTWQEIERFGKECLNSEV